MEQTIQKRNWKILWEDCGTFLYSCIVDTRDEAAYRETLDQVSKRRNVEIV